MIYVNVVFSRVYHGTRAKRCRETSYYCYYIFYCFISVLVFATTGFRVKIRVNVVGSVLERDPNGSQRSAMGVYEPDHDGRFTADGEEIASLNGCRRRRVLIVCRGASTE